MPCSLQYASADLEGVPRYEGRLPGRSLQYASADRTNVPRYEGRLSGRSYEGESNCSEARAATIKYVGLPTPRRTRSEPTVSQKIKGRKLLRAADCPRLTKAPELSAHRNTQKALSDQNTILPKRESKTFKLNLDKIPELIFWQLLNFSNIKVNNFGKVVFFEKTHFVI